MPKREYKTNRLKALTGIFSKPLYAIIGILSSIGYFTLFYLMVKSSNYGIFLLTVPVYVIYVISVTSGILLSLSLFSIFKSLLSVRTGVAGGVLSVVLPSVGSTVITCACSYPIIGTFLLFVGVNALELSAAISTLARYDTAAAFLIIAINVVAIYYYLGRIAKAEGLVHKRKAKR